MFEKVATNYRLAFSTLAIGGALMLIRCALWEAGVEGMTSGALTSSIVAGGVFVMGLVIAGTLSDYRDADRAPADLAAGLYSILREAESMERVWGSPTMPDLRHR